MAFPPAGPAPPASGYNPFYEDLRHDGPPRIAFSRTELLHLAGALVLLTAAFAFILDPRPDPAAIVTDPDGLVWATALLGMGTGFILHELAHKLVAQRYGHWAEFRATFSFLGLTLAAAAFLRIVFAAPGAVLIQGRVTPRESGLISLVGPGVNLAMAAGTFGAYLALQATSPTWGINPDDVAPFMLAGVARVNAALGIFNLIPVGPLDGRKILRWNKAVYALAVAASLALLLATLIVLD